MSISLYMDHHVPAAVTAGLRARGVDVLTSFEDGTSDWEDELLLEHGLALARVVYSQDDDFLALTHDWLLAGREFAGLVYAPQMGSFANGGFPRVCWLACCSIHTRTGTIK